MARAPSAATIGSSGHIGRVTAPLATYAAIVTASVVRLKFWTTVRCAVFSKPRSVHHSVGITPVKPPSPPMKPPPARGQAVGGAAEPGLRKATRGRFAANNIAGQVSTSSAPRPRP